MNARASHIAAWTLLTAAAVWVAWTEVWPSVGARTTSFAGYWVVGRAWWDGVDVAHLYNDAFLAERMAAHQFSIPEKMLGPPVLVLTLAPLAWLPYATARGLWLWTVCFPALVAAAAWLARRVGGIAGPLLGVALLTSPGVALGLEVGQVYPLYLLCHLVAWRSLEQPTHFGAALAPMIATRGWLGLPLAGATLLTGRWRPTAWTAVWTCGVLLATLPLVGTNAWRAFAAQLAQPVQPDTLGIPSYQGWPSWVTHLTTAHPVWGPDPPVPVPELAPWLLGFGTVAIGLAAWRTRQSPERLFGVAVCAELLLSPFTQDYQIPLAWIPLAIAWRLGARWTVLIAGALLWAPIPLDWPGLWGGWRSLAAYPRCTGLWILLIGLVLSPHTPPASDR